MVRFVRFVGRAVASALIAAVTVAGPGAPAGRAGGGAVWRGPELVIGNCPQVYAQFPVPVARARALVPASYRLLGEASGVAQVQVMMRRCQVSMGGPAEAATEARVGIVIDSPDRTGGMGPVPCCNYYLLWWASDSPLLTRWLRAGTGLDAGLVPQVSGMRFDFGPVAGVDVAFSASAPPPVPSPFVISADLVEPPPAPNLPFLSNFWVDTSRGRRVRLSIDTDNERAGWADGQVTVAPDTPLAGLLGAGPHPFGGPLSFFELRTATLTKEVHP